MTSYELSNFYLVMAVLSLVVGYFIGAKKNQNYQIEHPESESYTWGYTYAFSGIVFSIITIVHFLYIMNVRGYYYRVQDYAFLMSCYSAITLLPAVFAARRNPYGFVVQTLLSLNPLFWLVNYIYIKKRWLGLLPNRADGTLVERSYRWYRQLDYLQRTCLTGGIVWMIIVLAFFEIFEPFGRYLSDDEVLQIAFVMFVPPAALFLIRTLFLIEKRRK
ncbi:hypothetical protein ACMG4P_14300 [Pseudovibrio denitrificans]|uniref:hypothetical protein n=1 Tax=Pseudovibrio denitrificans TaxID=258256 RepID=UPI0039BF3BBF